MKNMKQTIFRPNEGADIVFINGTVITANANNDVCQAVAIQEEKIACVGSNNDMSPWIKEHTKIIDLNGKALTPGFIDSHSHFCNTGVKATSIVDISSNSVSSIEEIRTLLKEAVAKKKPGEWIRLQGYDQNKLIDQRHPTRWDLDDITPDNPVQCSRCCNHMAVYNTCALKLGGFTGPDNYPEGHVVMENGEMTGLLKESTHMLLLEMIEKTDAEVLEGIIAADQIFLSNGITSIHDAGVDGFSGVGIMEKATREGKIKTKIYALIFDTNGKQPIINMIRHYCGTGLKSGFGNEHFSIGACKLWMDGSTSGPSCATREPYSHDPNLPGLLVTDQEEANELISLAHNAGFQVTAHAIGDKAVEIFLNAVENALNANPRDNHRHRIEHGTILDNDLVDRIKALGIIPITNPGFFTVNSDDYVRYYGDRANMMYPLRDFIDKGIVAAIGADAPIIRPNPMIGIYGAITRTDTIHGTTSGTKQSISVLEAIKMYTYNGAYASYEEHLKGSIEVGKAADIAVLSKNILDVEPKEILDIVIEMTLVDGEIVYSKL